MLKMLMVVEKSMLHLIVRLVMETYAIMECCPPKQCLDFENVV